MRLGQPIGAQQCSILSPLHTHISFVSTTSRELLLQIFVAVKQDSLRKNRQPCLTGRQSSKMQTCRMTCSRMPWSAPRRPWKSTTSRKTSLLISKRSLIRNTTPPGTASLGGTLAAT
ncbi:hypothetical protein LDENG_00117180 [Lucifuga dentata]|nr:hypothetical protein LDENG_00117180 [Lucifuga dentata]